MLLNAGELESAVFSVSYNENNFGFVSASAAEGAEIVSCKAEDGVCVFELSGISKTAGEEPLFTLCFESSATADSGRYAFNAKAENVIGSDSIHIIGSELVISPSETSDAAIVFSDEELSADFGEELTVPVYISNNKGLCGYKLLFDYDSSIITPIKVVNTDLFGGTFGYNIDKENQIIILWNNNVNLYENGHVFDIVFSVDTEKAIEAEIAVSYSQPDTFTYNEKDGKDYDAAMVTKSITALLNNPEITTTTTATTTSVSNTTTTTSVTTTTGSVSSDTTVSTGKTTTALKTTTTVSTTGTSLTSHSSGSSDTSRTSTATDKTTVSSDKVTTAKTTTNTTSGKTTTSEDTETTVTTTSTSVTLSSAGPTNTTVTSKTTDKTTATSDKVTTTQTTTNSTSIKTTTSEDTETTVTATSTSVTLSSAGPTNTTVTSTTITTTTTDTETTVTATSTSVTLSSAGPANTTTASTSDSTKTTSKTTATTVSTTGSSSVTETTSASSGTTVSTTDTSGTSGTTTSATKLSSVESLDTDVSSTTTVTTATTVTSVTVTTQEEPDLLRGDANIDGVVDLSDATIVLIYYAQNAAGVENCTLLSLIGLDDNEYFENALFKAVDINEDGEIQLADATLILQYYAAIASGLDITWDDIV